MLALEDQSNIVANDTGCPDVLPEPFDATAADTV